ncbi:hypothetical protein GH733_002688 [Mirounga leonina]|nr:hypothetical protein GH733_002688 [Mirounga leonina]
MPNFCAASNCMEKSTQWDLAFFRFLPDLARCQNTVLQDNAIPTIFYLTSHLNNPHSGHTKRIKELSEDEIRTLKQKKKIDETSEQEPKHKEINNSKAQNPSAEEGGEEQDEDILPLTLEENENKEYLKSLFEILILMGKQNIPLNGHETDGIPEGLFTPGDFQALLECQINSGKEVLRKRFEITVVNTLFCSKTQQKQILDICERCTGEETLREVRDSHFFSITTDDVADIAGEEHLPVLVRFIDESHNLREEFVGFLPYEADAEIWAVKLHTTITQKWGLNMGYCHASLTLCPNNEGKGKELKEICHSQWTGRNDVLKLTDFDFIVTIAVLKNVLSFTRGFGKNLQGQTSDVFFPASSLTTVLHSLNEVIENIEVSHEFWFKEATN